MYNANSGLKGLWSGAIMNQQALDCGVKHSGFSMGDNCALWCQHNMSLQAPSYNCRGLHLGQSAGDKARRIVVDSLLAEYDILCLQETWLSNQDQGELNDLNARFLRVGESTRDFSISTAIVRGRIPGRVQCFGTKE
ncbi:hypothetical protein CRENBAI_007839 [Crenichthys baileyi]|uniref:Endonuclease/exonuclease/phosphatase domain-containing protein n=1 Tax=Crenichthys baileyi TaxID=28760 RepID=A0AAV9RYS5_9TELE